MRIVFFGTPEFAAYSLEKIIQDGWNVVAVVTAPDKPAGRGMKLKSSAVKEIALKHNLPVSQPTNLKSDDFLTWLKALDADLGIVIAFRMMPEKVWSMPKLGTFNLHASLLPQFRGAAPINHAIINGFSKTGVTTFFLKHEIDTGDIVLQKEVPILPDDNAGSLHDKLMETGAELVLATLKLVNAGNWPTSPQFLTGKELPAPKIFREFCQLSPDKSCVENHNKIRGLSPVPGAWVECEFGQLKIYKSCLTNLNASDTEAFLSIEGKKILLKCMDGWLEILELQPTGKPRMSHLDFINGQINQKN